jgi:mono/diheme cytochrome c family protein
MIYAATVTEQQIAITIAVVVMLAFVVYVWLNLRGARHEVGSEIELAPNRRPYLTDEELEGPKLDRALRWGLVSLVVLAVGLPAYWLREPSREEGEERLFEELAIEDNLEHGKQAGGAALFAPTAEGGFNCAGCHGPEGIGGVTEYTLTEPVVDAQGEPVIDPKTDRPKTKIRVVTWTCPPLNTVLLRFSEEEVEHIITYGRKGTPMPAWGLEGGGPMNTQQVSNLVAYIKSIQITPEEARQEAADALANALKSDNYNDVPPDQRRGAALFDLNCSRCHTQGYAFGEPEERAGGAFGPNLTGGVELRQFPSIEDHRTFIHDGSDFEVQYGVRGIGSGRMPGFAKMLTQDMIDDIVDYERSLD